MLKSTISIFFTFLSLLAFAQSGNIKGSLQDEKQEAVLFANIALHNAADSTMAKVEVSDETGNFAFNNIAAGDYFLKASYVGLADLNQAEVVVKDGETLDLGVLTFPASAIELETATVKADRVMVEVKADRTVFNVDGTINSTGSDAIELLRKAPGVTVDNNENISVLGRAGVLVYVDGKRLPLSGDDLNAYMRNLPADQIDKIEIITNPGAKYEAQGNAGIIDIRLKRDKSLGANGSIRGTYSKGRLYQGNLNFSGNYRNSKMNTFATAGYGDTQRFHDLTFESQQNNLFLDEINNNQNNSENLNFRLGSDFFLNDKNTVGFLINGAQSAAENLGFNEIAISPLDTREVDSILVADTKGLMNNDRISYNVNYRFDDGKSNKSLNVDLDYGTFKNDNNRYIPNQYFNAGKTEILSKIANNVDTDTEIDIYTGTVDYETNLAGGKFGIGTKYTRVVSDNTFIFSDEIFGRLVQNNQSSNIFNYDEAVYAAYLNYNRKLNDKWSMSAGLRSETTDATGTLEAFNEDLNEDPVLLNYSSLFPSAGLSWQPNQMNAFNLNVGRRINRPDYNVLNPFETRLSELSFESGNPRLNPEIVNNVELGYTLKYMYNFKIGYSKTTDQITRLLEPKEGNPAAGTIKWDNLAEQTVISGNISAPLQLAKKWSLYLNLSASHINNQANYGENSIVDVQAFTYNIYAQNTIELPLGIKGEISGYYNGPGVWGGVFEYESSWSLNFGLQRKFLQDKMNIRLSVNDVFYESGWDGFSEFNGLYSEGGGRFDSRRGAVSISYDFGNQNVKSRKRKTGIEDAAKRAGS
ncbi:MAG: iron complex outermembrane receptor protein [Saprospiraceae bacterium]|jgi:iron complex outermembrane receptor protein